VALNCLALAVVVDVLGLEGHRPGGIAEEPCGEGSSLGFDGLLQGRVRHEGVDEGAIESACHFGKLGGGDPTVELGALQFVDRCRGYSQPLSQHGLTHPQRPADCSYPAGAGTCLDGLEVSGIELSIQLTASLGGSLVGLHIYRLAYPWKNIIYKL
jgi:hypothetical protein